MANLNLSEFGEKLFVADADHTFIWDTVGAISKRVSRNSWLNSGTLTSDAPVTISQTWAGTASTVFTALKVNATSTASDPTSKLLDLQVGGVSKVSVDKTSVCRFSNNGIFFDAFGADTSGFQYIGQEQLVISRGLNGSKRVLLNNVGVFVGNASAFGFASTGEANATADTLLVRDSASGNTLALRNGANAQTFRVYNTYSNAGIDVEYLQLSTSAIGFRVGTNSSGSGSSRPLFLGVGGGSQWQINTAGHIGTYGSDNLYDIGASGANRPRNVYVGGTIFAPTVKASGTGSQSSVEITGAAGIGSVYFYPNSASVTGSITNPSDGVLKIADGAGTSFNRLQFGGTADTFPAIARDGAGLKITGAAGGSTSWIKVPPVAVSALPLAATAGAGARAFVNDASAPVFGTAVTGGGAVLVPVYSDGSAWYVG